MNDLYGPELAERYYHKVLEAIQNHRNPTLYQELNFLPLDKFASADLELMLRLFLTTAYHVGNLGAVSIVIEKWVGYNPEEISMPTQVSIFRFTGFDPDFYRFYIQHNTRWGFFEYVQGLQGYPEDEASQLALTQISATFGPQDPAIYQALLERQKQEAEINQVIFQAVTTWLWGTVTAVSPAPDWILTGVSDPIPSQAELVAGLEAQLPEWLDLGQANPTVQLQLIIDYYQAVAPPADAGGMTEVPGLVLVAPAQLTQLSQLAAAGQLPELSGLPELGLLYRSVREAYLSSRPEIFRVLGPRRRVQVPELLNSYSSDPCRRFGGCPMLTCICLENRDDDNEVLTQNLAAVEWFTHWCQTCGRWIPFKHQAVRMPEYLGGWSGCYCGSNEECLRADLEADDDRESAVEQLFFQLREIGLYDRRWPVEVPITAAEVPYPALPADFYPGEPEAELDFDLEFETDFPEVPPGLESGSTLADSGVPVAAAFDRPAVVNPRSISNLVRSGRDEDTRANSADEALLDYEAEADTYTAAATPAPPPTPSVGVSSHSASFTTAILDQEEFDRVFEDLPVTSVVPLPTRPAAVDTTYLESDLDIPYLERD